MLSIEWKLVKYRNMILYLNDLTHRFVEFVLCVSVWGTFSLNNNTIIVGHIYLSKTIMQIFGYVFSFALKVILMIELTFLWVDNNPFENNISTSKNVKFQ